MPTVAPPPMMEPAMDPAMSGAPADRPLRLYPSADRTDRAAQSPAPITANTVAIMMAICQNDKVTVIPPLVCCL